MRPLFRIIPPALLWTTLVCAIPLRSAHAGDASASERAAALLQEGVQRRAEGKDEVALLLFRQADALESTPKSRAQLALAEQSLGMWVQAEQHLRSALSEAGDPWIEKNRALLESSATRIAAELGWIDVMGAPAQAEILIDGESVGKSPLDAPARAAAGTRLLEVKAAGYEPYSRRILVRSGEVSRERGVFVESHPESSARPARSSAPRVVEVHAVSPLRSVGWITLGTGVAGALFGATSMLIRQNYVDGYNSDERCPGTASPDQPASCLSQQAGVSRWTTIGAASLIAGGALAATGITLVLVAPTTHTRLPMAGLDAACHFTGVGLSCGGRFQ